MSAPILKNSRWKRKDKDRVYDELSLGNPYDRLAARRLLDVTEDTFSRVSSSSPLCRAAPNGTPIPVFFGRCHTSLFRV